MTTYKITYDKTAQLYTLAIHKYVTKDTYLPVLYTADYTPTAKEELRKFAQQKHPESKKEKLSL